MLPWTVGGRNHRNQDLEDEIGHDIEMEIEELVRSGMSREQAERASRRGFGNELLVKEDIRETWSWTWIERLGQDLRYAARSLKRNGGFSLMAVLSLALGIGVATALFTVVHGLLLAPYPYTRPGEILEAHIVPNRPAERVPLRLSQSLEIAKLPAFSGVMSECPENQLLAGERALENLHATLLSGNAFQFLGARAMLGRTILPADIDSTGSAMPVVVISYKAWQRWFGGDPNALGKRLVLNGRARAVVGIMPPRFGWWTDVWLPLPTDRYDRAVQAKLRLSPGVSRESAEQQLQDLFLSMAPQDTRNFPRHGFTARLSSVSWNRAGAGLLTALRWLMLVAGFLLLIACANVANLQLARATVRSREIAVRVAVGAGPWRILRQFFTESIALSLIGGALGLLLALPLMPLIRALLPDLHALRPDEAAIGINGPAVLFSLAVSLSMGILSGFASAARASRPNLVEALKDASRASTIHTGATLRNSLVVVEVALSVVLLFGAIVTMRGFAMVRERGLGFQPVRVLAAGFSLSPKLYPGYAGRIAFAQDLLQRLQVLPGVESAAIANLGGLQSSFSIPGHPPAAAPPVNVGFISQDFARTLGIPLRAGRALTGEEIDRADRVGMVSQSAARRLWPAGASPIGAHIRLGLLENRGGSLQVPDGSNPEVTIVGIIADTGTDPELGTTHDPLILLPYTLAAPSSRRIFVRTKGSPMLSWDAVRREVVALDRDQSTGNPWTVEGSLAPNEDRAEVRFEMVLFGLVGLTGLALTAAGIYSVLSYTVARRTHEAGVRMALGATGRSVLQSMMVMGCRLVSIGMACGTLASFLLAPLMRTGAVPKTDAWAIAAIVALLIPPALLACYLPARRAVRLNPSAALRHE